MTRRSLSRKKASPSVCEDLRNGLLGGRLDLGVGIAEVRSRGVPRGACRRPSCPRPSCRPARPTGPPKPRRAGARARRVPIWLPLRPCRQPVSSRPCVYWPGAGTRARGRIQCTAARCCQSRPRAWSKGGPEPDREMPSLFRFLTILLHRRRAGLWRHLRARDLCQADDATDGGPGDAEGHCAVTSGAEATTG